MTKDIITNQEAIEMMNRCKHEIMEQRTTIGYLRPKAEAYDSIVAILQLLPQSGIGMGEDLVWVIDKRIRELQEQPL